MLVYRQSGHLDICNLNVNSMHSHVCVAVSITCVSVYSHCQSQSHLVILEEELILEQLLY